MFINIAHAQTQIGEFVYNSMWHFLLSKFPNSEGLPEVATNGITLIVTYAYKLNWLFPIDTALEILIIIIGIDLTLATINIVRYIINVIRGSGG